MTDDNDDVDWKDVLFIVGAQTTPEGDMLPGSFTVFPRTTPPESAVEVIMEKIADDLVELKVPRSVGSMAFTPIRSWEEFAEVPIDPLVKLGAIIAAGTYEFLNTMITSKVTGKLTTISWIHHCEDHS